MFLFLLKLNDTAIPALISVTGVLLSSIFSYISSYYGKKTSNAQELARINENHAKRLAQENKFERDKILRTSLQKLTQGYFNTNFNLETESTYFNSPEGQAAFYEIMSEVAAYGNNESVEIAIMLQKAVNGGHLLEASYDALIEEAGDEIPFKIDWTRYEINALTSLLISQIRYDINHETIDPKSILSVKFNNDIKSYRLFFEAGVNTLIKMLNLEQFQRYL